jgi:hypothetical protein
MKILILPFVDNYNIHLNTLANYIVDGIIHGARSLFGENAVDSHRLWYLYKNTATQNKEHLKHLWGKGFSYTGMLGDDSYVDRTDIQNKIKRHYFDRIIIPIHHTKCDHYGDMHNHLNYVLQFYNANKICFVDTWDLPNFDPSVSVRCPYFKRELLPEHVNHAHPLGGGWIPKEKYRGWQEKKYDFAPLIPASNVNHPNNHEHRKTYIYEDEKSYYDMYASSYFAYTCKKGGWDCMRHYEILANYCMPYFTDLESCPDTCMVDYPKGLMLRAKQLRGVELGVDGGLKSYNIGGCENILPGDQRGFIKYGNFDVEEYNYLMDTIRTIAERKLNTEQMVLSILDNMDRPYGNFR